MPGRYELNTLRYYVAMVKTGEIRIKNILDKYSLPKKEVKAIMEAIDDIEMYAAKATQERIEMAAYRDKYPYLKTPKGVED